MKHLWVRNIFIQREVFPYQLCTFHRTYLFIICLITATSAPSSPGNLSSTTLVALSTDPSTTESSNSEGVEKTPEKTSDKPVEKLAEKPVEKLVEEQTPTRSSTPSRSTDPITSVGESISATSSPIHMSR